MLCDVVDVVGVVNDVVLCDVDDVDDVGVVGETSLCDVDVD